MVGEYFVIARADGTDLRTGTVPFVAGTTVRAPASAPFRLVRSRLELILLGSRDDAGAAHAPWRVFWADTIDAEWDHGAAMDDGYAYMIGHEIAIVAEVPLAEALGCDPVARAHALRDSMFPRCTPGIAPALDAARQAALVDELLAICERNELEPSLADLRGLPVHCTTTPPVGPFRHTGCARILKQEARNVREDCRQLAGCDATGAIRRYIDEAEAIAARFFSWARPHHERWSFGSHETVIATAGPKTIIRGYLMWMLVEPMLGEEPRALANLFAPLAELVLSGALLVGWTDTACVLYQIPRAPIG